MPCARLLLEDGAAGVVNGHTKCIKVIKCDTLGNVIWQRVIGEGLDVKYIVRKALALEEGGVLIAAERSLFDTSQRPDWTAAAAANTARGMIFSFPSTTDAICIEKVSSFFRRNASL